MFVLVTYDVKTSDPVISFLKELDQSVEMRMISDVPFGAFLSGGIDSSAIVALMSRHSNMPVKTFSVGFEEQQYSELSHADIIARLFSTDHHELIVSQQHLLYQCGFMPTLTEEGAIQE